MRNQSGIDRKLDALGRVVIPIEIRRNLGWQEGTGVETYQFGHYVLLRSRADGPCFAPPPSRENPVHAEILENLTYLSERDILLALELLRRLAGE